MRPLQAFCPFLVLPLPHEAQCFTSEKNQLALGCGAGPSSPQPCKSSREREYLRQQASKKSASPNTCTQQTKGAIVASKCTRLDTLVCVSPHDTSSWRRFHPGRLVHDQAFAPTQTQAQTRPYTHRRRHTYMTDRDEGTHSQTGSQENWMDTCHTAFSHALSSSPSLRPWTQNDLTLDTATKRVPFLAQPSPSMSV